MATCSCPSGYKGDPFSHCRRVEPGKKPKSFINYIVPSVVFN